MAACISFTIAFIFEWSPARHVSQDHATRDHKKWSAPGTTKRKIGQLLPAGHCKGQVKIPTQPTARACAATWIQSFITISEFSSRRWMIALFQQVRAMPEPSRAEWIRKKHLNATRALSALYDKHTSAQTVTTFSFYQIPTLLSSAKTSC